MSHGAGTAGWDLPTAASLPAMFPTQLNFGSQSFQEISGIEKKSLNRTKARGGGVTHTCCRAVQRDWVVLAVPWVEKQLWVLEVPSTISLMASNSGVLEWFGWEGNGH